MTNNLKMNYEQLTEEDYNLIKETEKIIKKTYNIQYGVKVGSAILTKNKKIFTGVSLRVGTVTYCAEASALSNMLINDPNNMVDTIVACRGKTEPPSVISPCGVCRELLLTSFPNGNAIVKIEDEKYIKVKIKDLLPYPYYSSHIQSL